MKNRPLLSALSVALLTGCAALDEIVGVPYGAGTLRETPAAVPEAPAPVRPVSAPVAAPAPMPAMSHAECIERADIATYMLMLDDPSGASVLAFVLGLGKSTVGVHSVSDAVERVCEDYR
jgi:hypothetical protein